MPYGGKPKKGQPYNVNPPKDKLSKWLGETFGSDNPKSSKNPQQAKKPMKKGY